VTKSGLRFAFLCAVAAMATALHAAELFPIYSNYQKAIEQDDAAGAKVYLSTGRRAELSKKSASEALAAMDVISPKENLRLHEEIIEGDDATLIVLADVADNEATGRIQFVREQGTWKILSEMWDIGSGPEDEYPDAEKVRQPENDAQREALRKLREMGFPHPTADFLVMSAVEGNLEAVKLFVEAGYSVDTKDRDSPAIVSAAMFGHPEIVDWLIDHGADVNATDGATTALHRLADKCDTTATIRKLIAKGAKTDIKTAGGVTAEQLAEWANCTENVKALRGK
jgi:hypothetical protein